jgi:hypothetical protein
MTTNAKQDAEIVALKAIVQELGARLDKLEAATVDADGGRIERIEAALDDFKRTYKRDRGEHGA